MHTNDADSSGGVAAVHGMGELVSVPIPKVVPREGYPESKERHRKSYFVYFVAF